MTRVAGQRHQLVHLGVEPRLALLQDDAEPVRPAPGRHPGERIRGVVRAAQAQQHLVVRVRRGRRSSIRFPASDRRGRRAASGSRCRTADGNGTRSAQMFPQRRELTPGDHQAERGGRGEHETCELRQRDHRGDRTGRRCRSRRDRANAAQRICEERNHPTATRRARGRDRAVTVTRNNASPTIGGHMSLKRLALVTDAWRPQTNGVVNTLVRLVEASGSARHRGAGDLAGRAPHDAAAVVPGDPRRARSVEGDAAHPRVRARRDSRRDRGAARLLDDRLAAAHAAFASPPASTPVTPNT